MPPGDKAQWIVMAGDQTGQELLAEALRLLNPRVTQVNLEFVHYDLSLEKRRQTQNRVVYEAAAAASSSAPAG